MKKILTTLMLVLFCTVLLKPVDAKAVEFKDLANPTVEDMSNFDVEAKAANAVKWNYKKGESQDGAFAKFTITKESYVRFKVHDEGSKGDMGTQTFFRVYGNEAMIVPVYEMKIDGWDADADGTKKMPAGTYYVKCSSTDTNTDRNYTTSFMLAAIPVEDAVEVTQEYDAKNNKVVVRLKQKYATDFFSIYWAEGNENYLTSMDNLIDTNNTVFTVDKNGEYTVGFYPKSSVAFGDTVVHYEHIYVNAFPAEKGKTYKAGSLKYKVTKNNTNGTGTVCVMGATKKKPTSITIPKTVKLAGSAYTYTITKINSKAFYKKSKLKKVTIKATGIKSVGKRAFSGINKKAKIYVPKAKYKSYSKMLKKAGVTSSMKIRKK